MKKLIPLIFVSASLLFSGCSGESDTKEQSSEQQLEEVTIDMYGLNQFRFAVKEEHPNVRTSDTLMANGEEYYRVEEIMVEPGQPVSLKLTTISTMPPAAMSHNWVMLNKDADAEKFATASIKAKQNNYVAPDMEDRIYALTGLIAGGESETVEFNAPEEAGTYEYICTFPGHYSGGMLGILTVGDQM